MVANAGRRLEDEVISLPGDKAPYVLDILAVLNESAEPLGSGFLSRTLTAKGYQISEATVGRTLNELDQSNCTVKVGSRGRVITEQGRRQLERMKDMREWLFVGNRFLEVLQSRTKEDLIDVLMARRAIERELARLAAIHVTAGEIKLMEQVVAAHYAHTAKNLITAEDDVNFHKLVALAAKNKVLAATMDVIRNDSQLAPILEYIRVQVGGHLAIGHAAIVQAIKSQEPQKAEQAMIEHIESLISDVQKYWIMFYGYDR